MKIEIIVTHDEDLEVDGGEVCLRATALDFERAFTELSVIERGYNALHKLGGRHNPIEE